MKKRPCRYHFHNIDGTVNVHDISGTGATPREVYSLTKEMDRVRNEGIAKGIILEAQDNVGFSDGGRKLLSVAIGKNPAQSVLFTGCHHAREWISVEVPFLLAEYLVDEYPTSAPKNDHERRIKYLVDNRQIWIVPMVNPDGHEHTWLWDREWRSTRKVHKLAVDTTIDAPQKRGGPSRKFVVPAGDYMGVDPNRNYWTSDWGHETYWGKQRVTSRDPNDGQVWCGFETESEPEAKAIAALILNKSFRAGMTYHNHDQLLMYARRTKDDAFVQFVGKGMHQLINERHNPYTYQVLDALYPTTGNEVDYHLEKVPRRPVFVTEVRPGPGTTLKHSELPEDQIEPCFHENLAAALALICCAGHDAPSKSEKRGQGTSGHRQVKMPVIPNCWKVFEKWVP